MYWDRNLTDRSSTNTFAPLGLRPRVQRLLQIADDIVYVLDAHTYRPVGRRSYCT